MDALRRAGLSRRHLLLSMPALVASCAAPPPPPATLSLRIIAGADQNPDPSGHAAPVAIRIYDLAETGAFERADVFALADHDAATLGADNLGATEVLLAPGEQRVVTQDLKPGVAFVGVAVLFRDIDRATWRVQAPVAAHGPTKLVLHTAGVVATLAPT